MSKDEKKEKKVVTVLEEDVNEVLKILQEYEEMKSLSAQKLSKNLKKALGAAKYCCDLGETKDL